MVALVTENDYQYGMSHSGFGRGGSGVRLGGGHPFGGPPPGVGGPRHSGPPGGGNRISESDAEVLKLIIPCLICGVVEAKDCRSIAFHADEVSRDLVTDLEQISCSGRIYNDLAKEEIRYTFKFINRSWGTLRFNNITRRTQEIIELHCCLEEGKFTAFLSPEDEDEEFDLNEVEYIVMVVNGNTPVFRIQQGLTTSLNEANLVIYADNVYAAPVPVLMSKGYVERCDIPTPNVSVIDSLNLGD